MNLRNKEEQEAQMRKLDYYNNLETITIEQKEAIELKQIQKSKIKRQYIIDNLKKEERRIFLNHLPKKKWQLFGSILESELTDEIIDKEIEYCNY